MASLYDRLGGENAIGAVVETFYQKVQADTRIRHFFVDVDMDRQRLKQKNFLTMVTGGPANYTGKSMRLGHQHLLAKGLNDGHVDAVIELLGKALAEYEVSAADIKDVAALANSVRDDVLSRSRG